MSKNYLTRAAAGIKLNTYIPGINQNMFVKKSELVGLSDETNLTKYNLNDYVIDDDITKKIDQIALFETTYFNCTFQTYSYERELRAGYYKGYCGEISGLTSTKNYALDTCYFDLNNLNGALVIHRRFNILNYKKETLTLKATFVCNVNGIILNPTFEYTYSWGTTGFQGWQPKQPDFSNFYKTYYSYCKNITLEYFGALNN